MCAYKINSRENGKLPIYYMPFLLYRKMYPMPGEIHRMH
jgi:hypothetical protein